MKRLKTETPHLQWLPMVRIVTILFAMGIACTQKQALSKPERVDKILVLKSQRSMQLLYKGQVVRAYKVALGGNPTGHKLYAGDQKTPEGNYKISGHNPHSRFYKSLRISYPNDEDKKRAQAQGKSAGSDIMIHGLGRNYGFVGSAHTLTDWTLGCIAVTNEEVDEIYASVADGTTIEIRP